MYNSPRNKIKRILESLEHKALTTAEILELMLPVSSGSYKVTKNLLGYMDEPRFDYQKWKRQEQKRFYSLISKLRKDGLIKKRKIGSELWNLTFGGIKKLVILKEKKLNSLPIKEYKKEKSKDLMVVVFDVPEKFKYKRIWLRGQLRTLGFRLLQKSVWIGDFRLPEDFIHDLRELGLLPYTHILKVYKTGSIINF